MGSIKEKQRNFELRRQLFHIFLGLATIVLFYFEIIDALFIFIVLILGVILSLLSRKYKIPIIYWFLKRFEREDVIQKSPGKGSIYFLVGVLLTIKLFPKDIALTSIMILALGDSVSTLIGINFGRTKHFINGSGKKLLEGTLAGIVAAFIGCLVLIFSIPNFSVAILEAAIACIGAMIIETIDLQVNKQAVDDNIIVPLSAGAIITLMRILL